MIKKRGNPCGFPLVTYQRGVIQRLALGELEARASGFSTVLFTFFNP